MYQNCCKKCGSHNLYTEPKGNNVGLYCSDCGAWITWLSKDELRVFEHSSVSIAQPENQPITSSLSIDVNENEVDLIKKELNDFIVFLDKQIDKELCYKSPRIEDSLVRCAVAQAYEKDKNALINIANGKHWNEKF